MALAAIYVGRGTSALSIKGARAMLEERGVEVILVTAKELPKTLQEPNCRLLVMPGGRDRPYQASLGDEGARRIRQFVEQGGSYLGLCAGAYFASARVLFQPGTDMEVDEQRPLAFFPGTAWGAVTGPEFKYSSEAGTAGVNLGSDLIVYYNGGCSFKGEEEVVVGHCCHHHHHHHQHSCNPHHGHNRLLEWLLLLQRNLGEWRHNHNCCHYDQYYHPQHL